MAMARPILVSCESISKSFGINTLFSNLSLAIFEEDHVGLVGPNGSGKSTLLKILAGLEPPDEGTRTIRRRLRIGYVPQDPSFSPGQSIEEALAGTLLSGGCDPHEHAGRIAHALSIGAFPDAEQTIAALSGGWRKRLAIAQALLLEPDVLLMDEPTNHLDVDGILWLEQLLHGEAKAFVVISHDRRFLESVTSRMIELNRCYAAGFFEAHGRYSDFLEQREAALESQAGYQASLANRVRREVEWLRRGPKARTTKAKARVQSAERLIEELQESEKRSAQANIGIEFSASGRKSKQLLVVQQLGKSFGGKAIVAGFDLALGPGQRVGLLGPNGSGKTTLLQLLAGTLEPDAGMIRRADGLRVVFFDQHRETLDLSSTLRRALAPAGDAVVYQGRSIHLASWAKRFLFRPEQLDLPISRLSGGEQARLLIARLMLQPADLLILDEPTNDLDIPTLEVLEDSLLEFPGAVVLVTHDRLLLDRVSTTLLALDGTGCVQPYADYAQWEAARDREALTDPLTGTAHLENSSSKADTPVDLNRRPRKFSYREQQEWGTIEDTILAAEELVATCQAALQDPTVSSNATELLARNEALEKARAEVERLYGRWAELDRKRIQIAHGR
jgi:ATP-binding cassette subfamily F protein uup